MIVAILSVAICSAGFALGADDQHALIKSLGSAKVSLQQGLTAAQRQGQPISGKFEVEDGKFQLSVYTANNGQFSEVLVDYGTGKIAKSEPITQGGELDTAKAQSAALAKAKITLRAAIDKAAKGSRGFRAVSVTPGLKDGHAIALVVLLKGLRGWRSSMRSDPSHMLSRSARYTAATTRSTRGTMERRSGPHPAWCTSMASLPTASLGRGAQCLFLWTRIGRANREGQFDIVCQSKEPVHADPFLIGYGRATAKAGNVQ
jgi:hypothetical protein